MKAKYAGFCQKDNQHQWKLDEEIFISKGGDGKWIMCTQKQCFIDQGGKIQDKKQFQSAKFPLQSVGAIKDITYGLLDEFEKKYNQGAKLPLEVRAVFFESLFRTVSQNFKP